MKTAIITLVIGHDAQQMYEIAKPLFENYCKRTDSDLVVISNKQINVYANNLEKFQLYKILSKYDRVIYLDTDILIHPQCPNMFNMVPINEIGAVYDNPSNSPSHTNRLPEINKAKASLGNIPEWDKEYINSGVLVLSKTHRDLFRNPEDRLKLNSGFKDQTLINYNIHKLGYKIHKLPSKFNGMEITGFSSRTKNPKHPHLNNNKTEAYIMHFANEGNKIANMRRIRTMIFTKYPEIRPDGFKPSQQPIKPKPIHTKTINPQIQKMSNQFNQIIDPQPNEITLVDFSELGWSMYNAGHALWLKRNKHHPVSVILRDPGRKVLYRSATDKFYPMPQQWYDLYGQYMSDGNHLYNQYTNERMKNFGELLKPIKNAYPQLTLLTKYSKFENERIMEAYTPSKDITPLYKSLIGEKCIVIFPRFRTSKFACRNIPNNDWVRIVDSICNTFKAYPVVAIGSKSESVNFNLKYDNLIDLCPYNDNLTLELLVYLCVKNLGIACIGNQSAPPKISLLCGCPSYMFGHERKRHQTDENWAKTKCGFWDVKVVNGKYSIPNVDAMIQNILQFISSCL